MGEADGRVLGSHIIVDNGPHDSRWILAIVSEGFTEPDLEAGDFAEAADVFVRRLLAASPFDEFTQAINVHRVDVASDERGADIPCDSPPVSARTFFDARYCERGVRHLLVADQVAADRVVRQEVGLYHMIAMIVNSGEYGGSGLPGFVVFSTHRDAALIGIHETGHAFGLADEYSSCTAASDLYSGPPLLRPNVSEVGDPSLVKWRGLFAGGGVPTTSNPAFPNCSSPPNPAATGAVGVFEGGSNFRRGVFRPEFDCRMRSIGTTRFCAVCTRRIREVLSPFQP